MGLTTAIEWADSTANLQMGCDGCELWNGRDIKECYAGNLVNFHAGNPGWPDSFNQPKLFPHRLQEILKWPDLTGTKRPDKPWLNGRPRIVFLDDLGDTFTPSLPKDWLAEHLEALGKSPHIYVVLTKQAKAMAEFSERHPLPANFWPGTSVTSQSFAWRLEHLKNVQGGSVRVISAEPLHEAVSLAGDLNHFGAEGWLIIGGASGPQAPQCDTAWIRLLARQGKAAGASIFVKQLGARPYESVSLNRDGRYIERALKLADSKGGDPEEWPKNIRIREVPKVQDRSFARGQ